MANYPEGCTAGNGHRCLSATSSTALQHDISEANLIEVLSYLEMPIHCSGGLEIVVQTHALSYWGCEC
jgi:hypothetical protein